LHKRYFIYIKQQQIIYIFLQCCAAWPITK